MLYPVAFRTGGSLHPISSSELGSVANYVLEYMAANDGAGTLTAGTSGTGNVIGTLTDTYYAGNIGEGNIDIISNVVNFYFDETAPSGSDAPRFLVYDTNQSAIRKAADSEITDIADAILTYTVQNDGPNSYQIGTSAPVDGGTWATVATFYDAIDANTQNTYNLYKKVSAASYSLTRPLKAISTGSGVDLQRFTDTDLQLISKKVRERLLSTNIGRYFVGITAPEDGGVWVEKGTYTNIRPTIASQGYGTLTYISGFSVAGLYEGTADSTPYATQLYQIDYVRTQTNSYSLSYVGPGAVNYAGSEYVGILSFDINYTGDLVYTLSYEVGTSTYLGPSTSYTTFADAIGYILTEYTSVPVYSLSYTSPAGTFSQDFSGSPTTYTGSAPGYVVSYTGPTYEGSAAGDAFATTVYTGTGTVLFSGAVEETYTTIAGSFDLFNTVTYSGTEGYTATVDYNATFIDATYVGAANYDLNAYTGAAYDDNITYGSAADYSDILYAANYLGKNDTSYDVEYIATFDAAASYVAFAITIDYIGSVQYEGQGLFTGPSPGGTYSSTANYDLGSLYLSSGLYVVNDDYALAYTAFTGGLEIDYLGTGIYTNPGYSSAFSGSYAGFDSVLNLYVIEENNFADVSTYYTGQTYNEITYLVDTTTALYTDSTGQDYGAIFLSGTQYTRDYTGYTTAYSGPDSYVGAGFDNPLVSFFNPGFPEQLDYASDTTETSYVSDASITYTVTYAELYSAASYVFGYDGLGEYTGPGTYNVYYEGATSQYMETYTTNVPFIGDYTGTYTSFASFNDPPTLDYSGLTATANYTVGAETPYVVSSAYGDVPYDSAYEGSIINSTTEVVDEYKLWRRVA